MKNHPSNFLADTDLSFSNEEALHIVLNNLQETFILVNRQFQVIHLTEQTKEWAGKNLKIDFTAGNSILDLAEPGLRDYFAAIYRDVFNGSERQTITELKRDGKASLFEIRFKPARNKKGEIIGAVVSWKDVTEQKISEHTLMEAEERWRFALEGGNQGVWDWKIQTGEIFFSDSYKKLYGYEPDDLKGRIEEWEMMIHPNDKERMRKAVEEHLSGPDPYHETTYRVKTKNDNYKWVLGRGMIIRNEEGKPLRMIGTHTDITKQVAAEQTYRLLFYNNPLPMWTYNLDSLLILAVNEAALIHYGYSNEEFLSMTIKDIRPREDVEKLMTLMEKRKTLGHVKRTARHLKKNGEIITVELSTHRLEDSNTVVVVAQDITERKYSEQILSLERSVFELSNKSGVEFKDLADTLLAGWEEIHTDACTALLLLNDDDTIEVFTSPRLPSEYSKKLNGIKTSPDEGSCGAAMWRKETVIVEDINTDPLWQKHKSLALQYGLQSCWSLPVIHTSGKVMGSFAIYHKKIKRPSSIELNTLERVRNMIRILMEHHSSLEEIKKVNERFDMVMRATHDLIWDWNVETGIIHRDAHGLQEVYGIEDNKSIQNINLWLSHIHPDDMERMQTVIAEILQSEQGNTFDVEYRFKRDDRTYSHVYDRGMIHRNKEGKPVRIIGAAQNITERKNLEEELLCSELEKQKAINQATVNSQELERTEIGKELHDNVNQVLTTTKLYLDLASSHKELKDELIKKSTTNIISVINEIRQLSRSLMDPTIGDLGLIDSINDLIENINLTRRLHVRLIMADQKLESLLSKTHKLTIFRIIQEALNNAMKHAKATTVLIFFKLYGNTVEVIIEDDGVGFDPSQTKMGAGLKNIKNRVYLINGNYTIESTPEKGCKIIIEFPVFK